MIDRKRLVDRHRVTVTRPARDAVFTVGNGDFAYSTDATGMQSFTRFHDQSEPGDGETVVATPTMSNWGWHEMPNPEGFVLADAMTEYATARGPVSYPDRFDLEGFASPDRPADARAGDWLHVNPQRIDLGRIGFAFRDGDGIERALEPSDLGDPRQSLDLWGGVIESSFELDGQVVHVTTVASPSESSIAFRVRSALLASGRLSIRLRFPYADAGFFETSDWSSPGAHSSVLAQETPGRCTIERRLDDTTYSVRLVFSNGSVAATGSAHEFRCVVDADADEIELVAAFAPGRGPTAATESFADIERAARASWERFWMSGAAVEIASESDPRAEELERRVILSQYLTAVNCSGTLPPQETGLVTNSWHGKFHLEMHLWHGIHFAAWGRPELLERSFAWYESILPMAIATARRQGYAGARWPKQVGPDGRESPSPIGSLLVWQQPHIMFMLEMVWRASGSERRSALVHRYAELVRLTADFMADFAEEREGVFHLPSPVMPAQESYEPEATEDPTFELAYWWWGLEIAQVWAERAGGGRDSAWQRVQDGMARPLVRDGCYAAIATEPYLRRVDHPALLAAYGLVPPTPVIDTEIMRATLLDVASNWDWASAWGWDFPVMAMTATRLGEPGLATDFLMRDELKNRFSVVGHNAQLHDALPIYLPGNGSLLAAVSLMATTLDEHGRPSFPATWDVRAEGFIGWP